MKEPGIKKILAAVDFSDSTNDVINMTRKMALIMEAEVAILHTIAPANVVHYYYGVQGPFYIKDFQAEERKHSLYTMNILKHKLEEARVNAHTILLEGPTVENILAEAEAFNADLIITGAHHHGALYSFFVGSVSEKLIHKVSCPIMIVPHRKRSEED